MFELKCSILFSSIRYQVLTIYIRFSFLYPFRRTSTTDDILYGARTTYVHNAGFQHQYSSTGGRDSELGFAHHCLMSSRSLTIWILRSYNHFLYWKCTDLL
jgi:hypothetical protein